MEREREGARFGSLTSIFFKNSYMWSYIYTDVVTLYIENCLFVLGKLPSTLLITCIERYTHAPIHRINYINKYQPFVRGFSSHGIMISVMLRINLKVL